MLSGSEIVKKNTSIIELGVGSNNKMLDRAKTLDRAFKLNDLILVGILSLLFGFIVAFILIRLNLKPSSTKTMVEEEVLDDTSIFQSNLSISNDIEIQELDLVRTYIDMDDWESAQIILDKLITTSTDELIISAAKNLLDKKK
jgi:FimV-like protein